MSNFMILQYISPNLRQLTLARILNVLSERLDLLLSVLMYLYTYNYLML